LDLEFSDLAIYQSSASLDLTIPGTLTALNSFLLGWTPEKWPDALLGCSICGVLGERPLGLIQRGKKRLFHLPCAKVKLLPSAMCFGTWSLSVGGWVYWNESPHNLPDWQSRYWGGMEAYQQLLEVKHAYDPGNVFACYHCVGWEEIENVDPTLCPDGCSCSNQREENICANHKKKGIFKKTETTITV